MNGSPEMHGSAIPNVPNAKVSVSNKLRNAYRSPLTKPLCGHHRRVTQNAEICLVNNRIAEARAPGVDYVVACSSAALPFGRGYICEIDRLDEFGNSRA